MAKVLRKKHVKTSKGPVQCLSMRL